MLFFVYPAKLLSFLNRILSFDTNIIFRFDHNRTKHSDDQKDCHIYNPAIEIQAFSFCKSWVCLFF